MLQKKITEFFYIFLSRISSRIITMILNGLVLSSDAVLPWISFFSRDLSCVYFYSSSEEKKISKVSVNNTNQRKKGNGRGGFFFHTFFPEQIFFLSYSHTRKEKNIFQASHQNTSAHSKSNLVSDAHSQTNK